MLSDMAISKREIRRWLGNFQAVEALSKREVPTWSNDESVALSLSMIAAGRASAPRPDEGRLRRDQEVRATWARLRARWA
jgi:hypothetical protein